MSSLDAHEGRWKAQYDLASNSSSYYSSLYFSSMQIGASIVTKVVENLQVGYLEISLLLLIRNSFLQCNFHLLFDRQLNVRNVHIRFEEEVGSRTRVIAFGVTLESLTAQSCDSSWNPLSASYSNGSSTECSYKTLQLNKFGIYCDTKGERLSHIKPHELRVRN
jgi:vacuolar protein sorting-associated protein 13D